MKFLIPSRQQVDTIMNELNTYITQLHNSNDSLRKKIQEFNKEEEILKLQNEMQKMREHSVAILSEQEIEDARVFRDAHYESCKGNTIYIVEGTGIGDSITVKCNRCGTEKNISDVTNW